MVGWSLNLLTKPDLNTSIGKGQNTLSKSKTHFRLRIGMVSERSLKGNLHQSPQNDLNVVRGDRMLGFHWFRHTSGDLIDSLSAKL